MADEIFYGLRGRLGEVYCFYFLSFEPPYDFDRVNNAIAEFFEAEGVSSYGCYEIFGAVDVVVGAWIASSSVISIESRLIKFLSKRNCSVNQVVEFRVSNIAYHHLWPNAAQRNGLQAEGAPSPVGGLSAAQVDAMSRDELIRNNWLRTIADNDDGTIRVFISIPPFRTGGRPLQENLIAMLSNELGQKVPNSKLYSGVGHYISLLVEAQININEYPKISEFNTLINELGLKNFGLKTTTYLTTSRSHKRSASVSSFKTAAEYLSLPETEILEVKGSVSLDISRLLMTEKAEKNDAVTKEALGTIVALLNTKGGELVIGAVEEKKFKGTVREKLQQSFPEHGDGYRVIGIESEFCLSSDQSWDGYLRRLTDSISTRIGPGYGPHLSYGKVSVEEGRTLCVVQVSPLSGQDLAWLDNEFCYVRAGPSTQPLKGQHLTDYLKRRR